MMWLVMWRNKWVHRDSIWLWGCFAAVIFDLDGQAIWVAMAASGCGGRQFFAPHNKLQNISSVESVAKTKIVTLA
jgi:hypothetical protein